MGIQPQKAEVGPTSGPTWRLSHFVARAVVADPDPGGQQVDELVVLVADPRLEEPRRVRVVLEAHGGRVLERESF